MVKLIDDRVAESHRTRHHGICKYTEHAHRVACVWMGRASRGLASYWFLADGSGRIMGTCVGVALAK